MIVEAPEGVGAPIYRRVIVGYVARGPNGLALCLECNTREVRRRTSRFCGMECRRTYRRRERGPKARFLPCPVCGVACIRCARGVECRRAWTWRGRVPVFGRSDGRMTARTMEVARG